MRRVGIGLLLCAGFAAPEDVAVDLARLLGPDGAAYAKEIAGREDVGIQALLDATRRFAPAAATEPGERTWNVELSVEEQRESMRITTYVPGTRKRGEPAPALLYLHGAGGRGEEAVPLWRTAADALGMIVIAPTDSAGEPGYGFTARERARAMAALRWARQRFDLDEDRIHLTGVSRGGHMAWDLGSRFPDRWASISPMIGGPRWLPQRGQNNIRFLENLAHLPLRDLQGAQDQEGLLLNLQYAFAKLEKLGAKDARLLTFADLGHSFRMEAVDWPEFLGGAKRDAAPERVVLCCADPARAAWLQTLALQRDVKEEFTPRVDGRKWPSLDHMGQRAYMDELVSERTARIEGRWTGRGRFEVKSRGVRRFRILLAPDMFDEHEAIEVVWNGRKRKKSVRPSREVLLREFRDRFDRRFTPVAEIEVP